MRKVKDANERKNEILDAAEGLFTLKGYDNTSTGDILKKTGIARGTLYYHFKSKEDILDALINRIVDGQVAEIRLAVSKQDSAKEQISSFIQAMRMDSPIAVEIVNEAHKPQNALMHQKMQRRLLDSIIPLATEMFKNGTLRGIYSTKHPEEAAEMLILHSSIVFDDLNDMDSKTRRKKIAGFIYNMERLLGYKEGELSSLSKVIR